MELIEAIKKAGVVGAGGAGFPTHVKLNAKAEYLIINAAECEPLIETDKFLCREFADRIIDTILLMGHHLEAPAHLLPDKMSALEKSQLQHVSHGSLSPTLQSQPYILLLIRSQCAVLLNDAP